MRNEGFDVLLSRLCRHKLRCLIIAPELFHHHVPPHHEGFTSSAAMLANEGPARPDDIGLNATSLGMGVTDNVLYSARCWALFGKNCT